MENLEILGSDISFYCYKDGKRVRNEYMFDDIFDPECDAKMEVVEEETLDLSMYDEVHIRQEIPDETVYGLTEEVDDDYKFKVKMTHVIFPTKEVWNIASITDDVVDESMDTSSGWKGIDFFLAKAGSEEMEDFEPTDEDERDGM